MSSCTVVGFFELRNGRVQSTEVKKPDGGSYNKSHVHYDSDVICSKKASFPAEIRQYTTSKDPILRDHTVAFVVAKFNVATHNGVDGHTDILLKAWHIAPVPGDPEYDEGVIDFEMPLVFALGIVRADYDGTTGGVITFPVTVTDFVRGSVRESILRCRLDKSMARWANVPVPRQNSLIEFIGRCHADSTIGSLCVEVEKIVFCFQVPLPSPSTPLSPATDRVSKRRKYGPRTPVRDAISDESTAERATTSAVRLSDPVSPTASRSLGKSSKVLQALSALDDEHREMDFAAPPLVFRQTAALLDEMLPTLQSEDVLNVEGPVPSTRSKGKRKAPPA